MQGVRELLNQVDRLLALRFDAKKHVGLLAHDDDADRGEHPTDHRCRHRFRKRAKADQGKDNLDDASDNSNR